MTVQEANEIAKNGVDIQLHTHRHIFPDDDEHMALKEIADNKSALESVVDKELKHFCYPSGVYSETSIEFLRKCGIATATTTDPGFNHTETPPLQLKRFLDSETITELEFEAELCGFFELVRKTGFRI